MSLIAKIQAGLRRRLCEHPLMPLVHEQGRVFARCSLCGYESPGIEVTPRLHNFLAGDPERLRLKLEGK